MTVTTYDDGRSCPAGCDAHVVFKKAHNGTPNAFLPAPGADPLANRGSPARGECRASRDAGTKDNCVICFGPENASCMITTYRGSGPKLGRFDVTPAFLKRWCTSAGIPETLKTKCDDHAKAVRNLAARVNCIANPDHPKCRATMAAAEAAKREDKPPYQACKEAGEASYNRSVSDPSLQRLHDCAYFKNRRDPYGGWSLLAPAACAEGYYVGKAGLDCCSADPYQAAIDPIECGGFYR